MKNKFLVFLLSAAIGSAVAGPTEDFDERAGQLAQLLASGQVTEMQSATELAELAARLFPTDYRFQSLRNYRVLLASRLERGEIKRDEFDYLWKERRLQYLSERSTAQQQADQDAARIQSQNNAAALQVIGNSIRRTTAPTGINCITIGASTTCN